MCVKCEGRCIRDECGAPRGPNNPVCDEAIAAAGDRRVAAPAAGPTLAIRGDPAAHYPRAAEHTAVSRDPGGEGVMPHHPVFNLWPTVRFMFLAACVVWIVYFAVSDSSDPTVPAATTVPVLVGADGRPVPGLGGPAPAPVASPAPDPVLVGADGRPVTGLGVAAPPPVASPVPDPMLVGADGRPVTGLGVPVAAPAKPARHHLVYSIACRTTEDFGKLTELFLVNDRKATTRWLGDALRAGTCRRFLPGTVVYKTWATILTGLSKFHAKGDPTEWWGIIDGHQINIYASATLS